MKISKKALPNLGATTSMVGYYSSVLNNPLFGPKSVCIAELNLPTYQQLFSFLVSSYEVSDDVHLVS